MRARPRVHGDAFGVVRFLCSPEASIGDALGGAGLKIAKVLNNNIAIAVNDRGKDVIVMGCGVAFQKRHGDEVDESKIERLFSQNVPTLSRRFGELAVEIPEEYFEAAQSIVASAKMRLGRELDDTIYLTLTDHIYFTLDRFRKGLTIYNRLLLETKMIYREEFSVALEALTYLDKRFDVDLPEDEAAFIALHLVNADTDVSMSQTFEITRIVQQINSIIRNYFKKEIPFESLAYYRLMVHLKFFATRVVTFDSVNHDDFEDRQLFDLIKTQYAESYRCAELIRVYIEKTYSVMVGENEEMYLTIHIERVFGKSSPRADQKPI